jgi:hypothetical protein
VLGLYDVSYGTIDHWLYVLLCDPAPCEDKVCGYLQTCALPASVHSAYVSYFKVPIELELKYSCDTMIAKKGIQLPNEDQNQEAYIQCRVEQLLCRIAEVDIELLRQRNITVEVSQYSVPKEEKVIV